LRKVSAQWILAQGPGSVEILATKVQCGQQCWYKNSLMHIREVYPRACLCLFPGAHAPSLPLCTSFLSLNNLDLLSCLVLSSCLFFFFLVAALDAWNILVTCDVNLKIENPMVPRRPRPLFFDGAAFLCGSPSDVFHCCCFGRRIWLKPVCPNRRLIIRHRPQWKRDIGSRQLIATMG
jgi:hypothetical protein